MGAGGAAPTFDLLRRDDPDFDEQDFRDLVAWLVMKVHHAITDRSLDRIRDHIDDRALASLQARIDASARVGHVETVKDLRVEGIDLVSVTRDGPTQRVVLHVTASATTSVTEEASGRLVAPDIHGDGAERRRFVEVWTLARSVGTTTTTRKPPLRCPYCGAPIVENRRYVCAYCRADLRGPQREWTILTFSPW